MSTLISLAEGLYTVKLIILVQNKTGVVNDPLSQARSHASSEHCFLFCFSVAVTLGWPSGSK